MSTHLTPEELAEIQQDYPGPPTYHEADAIAALLGHVEALQLKLDSYRALIVSVVTAQSAPDNIKSWLRGVSEKIEATEGTANNQ
jgi:hypothetical protein